MRVRALRVLDIAAGAACIMFAQLGVALLFIRYVIARRAPNPRGWLVLWSVGLIPVVVLEVATGHFTAGAHWLVQAIFGVAAGWVLTGKPSRLRSGLLIGICIVLAVQVITQSNAGQIWNRASADDSSLSLVRSWLSEGQSVRHRVTRSWSVPARTSAVSVSTDVKVVASKGAWSWQTNGEVEVTPDTAEGRDAAILRFGREGDPYAQRWFDTGEAVRGRKFRVTLELRSAESLPARKCRGVWLQAWGPGGGGSCHALDVGTSWRTFAAQWTAPATAETHIVRVVLNNFNGHSIHARDVRLEELHGGAWKDLSPLAPAASRVDIHWGRSGASDARTLMVTSAVGGWQRIQQTLTAVPPEDGAASSRGMVTVAVVPADGSVLLVRHTDVLADGNPTQVETPVFRQGLWFGHPNLAGHSLAAGTLAALTLPGSLTGTLAVLLLGIWSVFLTGSRTAMLALAGGGVLLVALRYRKRSRWIVPVLGAVVLIVAALVATSLLGRIPEPSWLTFNDGQATPRTAIWSAAAQAFTKYPLAGLAGARESFAAFWRSSPDNTTGEFLTHAHDLWLQFAANYGLVGLLATFWIAAGLVIMGWRRAGLNGAVFTASILFMNVFDYTLFFTGVLVPLILGINMAIPADDKTEPRPVRHP